MAIHSTYCPHCGMKHNFRTMSLGAVARCRSCGEDFQLPKINPGCIASLIVAVLALVSCGALAACGGLLETSSSPSTGRTAAPHRLSQQQEAVYHGRPLSSWAKDLSDRDVRIRFQARDALQDAGQPAVPYLVGALEGNDPVAKNWAAQALIGMRGADRSTAVPALILCLKERDQDARRSAIGALGSIGPPARDALPALRALPGDREHADRAIRRIRGEASD